ncbi:MAG TPA: PKD domain-containing protein, partial [Chitinophagaceae bacterium]|nr:PKD domain-containing protein [Chitinophagaceae bacterium]
HIYDFTQIASVSLTAVNSFGCSNSISKENSVTVLRPVIADFVASQVNHCSAPANVTFTNRSGGPGTLSYTWDFGDGGSSSDPSPAHQYTARGVYTVKMTVNSSEGCSNQLTRTSYINVAGFNSDFQVPAQLCSDANLSFNNISTPQPDQSSWLIDGVGGYTTYYGYPLLHFFGVPGMHTIELLNRFGACEQRVSKQFEIKKRPALNGFLIDITGLCGAPVQVNFKDTSSSVATRQWNFNYYNNNSTIDATTPSASFIYPTDNIYYTQLTVTNADGCSESILKPVAISRPLIGIFPEPGSRDEGCVPVTTKFSIRTTEALASFKWNFGDGQTSTDAVPSHTYTVAGMYNVSLTYTTINGCTGTVNYFNTIRVRQPPVADFSVVATACGNTPVQFINQSSGFAYNYIWNFGEGPVNESNAIHQYQSEGEFNVMLIANNGMCNDTIVKSAIIKISPPFAQILRVVNTCAGDRGLVSFIDGSRQANSWRWDFGDGSSTSYSTAQPEIEHHYLRSGQFKAVLTVTNGACVVKDSTTVWVLLKQNPVLTANAAAICTEGGSLSIKVDNLAQFVVPSNYYVPPYYSYRVVKEDGNPVSAYVGSQSIFTLPWSATLSGFTSGQETFRVISQSAYFNCYDTTNLVPLTISGPSAAFAALSPEICYKSPVQLQDNSTGGNNIPLVKWEWSFGDGQSAVSAQAGTVTHLYRDPGVYYVTLRVTDANGCSSSITNYANPVNVTGPKVSFSASGTNVPLNTTVNFYNYTNAYNTTNVVYKWDFGNSVTSAGYSPSYTYTVAGDYTVTLIAVNAQTQCSDTARLAIKVRDFNTGFTTSTSLIGSRSSCPPVLARFSNTSTNFTRLVWDFGDGSSLEDRPYPEHIYTRTGIYIVKLFVYGYNGLSDTFIDTIVVSTPQATIAADAFEGCIGKKIQLHAPAHQGIASYSWDFGNGYVGNANDSFSVHQYLAPGSYMPSLIVTDAGGCQSSVALPQAIVIHPDPLVKVTPLAPVACKGAAVQLQATGAAQYSWSPAAGLSAVNIPDPFASPASTMMYSVSGTDENGCKGNGSITVTVPVPFTLAIASNAEVCRGSSVQLKAEGAASYAWVNGTTGLSNAMIPDPIASPLNSTEYTVTGYDEYNCYSDTKTVNVTVHDLPTVNVGADREVIYGSENELKSIYSSDVTKWSWSPPDYLSCTTCPAPVSRPYGSMDYILTVSNNYKCLAKDTVHIKGICTDGNIYIPTAFTPNNDGNNDLFTVNGYGVSRIISFRVYNRWGEVVFMKKDFHPNDNSSAWNGRFKGVEAPTGVYVYFVEMECALGERFERKGSVTLIR